MKILRAVFLLLLIIASPLIKADGNRLLDNCQSAEKFMDKSGAINDVEAIKAGVCIGLIDGTLNTVHILNEVLEPKYRTCWSKEGTNGQAVRVVLKFLRNNPETLHNDDTVLVILAYNNAYPCTNKLN